MGTSMSRNRRASEQGNAENANQPAQPRQSQSGYPGSQYPGAQYPGNMPFQGGVYPGYPGAQQPWGPGMQPGPQHMYGMQPMMGGPGPRFHQGQGHMVLMDGRNMFNMGGPQIQPTPMQRTCTIRNDVNLKKKTIEVLRDEANENLYHVKFMFDASADCKITMYYAAKEKQHDATEPIGYETLIDGAEHGPVVFEKGLGQTFTSQPEFAVDVSQYSAKDLVYQPGSTRFPLIICLETVSSAEAGSSTEEASKQKAAVSSQTTYATLSENSDGSYGVKVIKQKIHVGNTSYELQEIYGIEQSQGAGEEGKEDARNCVVCMECPRDTTVLPCRHMCMCFNCAKVLSMQSNKCPICRGNVDSLLQIKGSDKKA